MKNRACCFLFVLGAFALSLAFSAAPPAAEASPAEEAREKPPSPFALTPSRLEKLRSEGNIYGFRIELEKLLKEPAKDFFLVTEAFFDPKRRKRSFHSMIPSAHQLASLPDEKQPLGKVEAFIFEETALAFFLLPPFGKTDRHGLTPSAAAGRAGNFEAAALFRKYTASDHEIYEGGKETAVWEKNPGRYPEKEDFVLRRLPQTPLEKTAVGRALLAGDLSGFLKALDNLYEGPAWKSIALLHSRETKTQKTVFHLLAEARFPAPEIPDADTLADMFFETLNKEIGKDEPPPVKIKSELSKAIQQINAAAAGKPSQVEELVASQLERRGNLSEKQQKAFLKAWRKILDFYSAQRQPDAKAVKAFENMIETIVPHGLSAFRKAESAAESIHIKAISFAGMAGALSLASSIAAFGMDQNIIGSGLAVLAGWNISRCRAHFKSYKSLKSGR